MESGRGTPFPPTFTSLQLYKTKMIKGIKINDLETKLLHFADDTTIVLSDFRFYMSFVLFA